MKNLRFLSLFIMLFSVVSLTSCDDEAIDGTIDLTGTPEPNPSDAVFRANFNGGTWTADNTTVVFNAGTISIIGYKGALAESFTFMLNGTSPGSYLANVNDVRFNPSGATAAYAGVNPNNVSENTGAVTITSIDTINHTISGIFSFKGYWTSTTPPVAPVQFTNGVFTNLPYTGSVSPNPTPANNSFFTKINGTDFLDTSVSVSTANNVIAISGIDASGDVVTVGVRNTAGVGTHTITGNIGTDVVQGTYLTGAFPLQAYSGSVTISIKTPNRVKGTFNFTTSDGPTIYQFTAGQFDIEY